MIVKYKYEPKVAITLDPKGTSLKVAIKIRDDVFIPQPSEKLPRAGELGFNEPELDVHVDKRASQSIYKLDGLNKWSAGVLATHKKRLIVQWSKTDVYFYNF